MIYKTFQDKKLSTLGLGCMRLPTTGNNGGPINIEKATKLIEYAYEHGVNYFDTAYGYHGGESERVTGKVLSQYPRDTWYLASKMPGHMMSYKNKKLEFQGYMANSKAASPSDIFEEQLEKCGVDYFDFYLLHNLCETSYDFYTDKELRVTEYLLSQKKAGHIKHLGLSTHGRPETIENFLNIYDCFEFIQLQINYLDWVIQDAKAKYEIAEKHHLPVIAMESCRGGALVSLNPTAEKILKKARPDDPIVHWAFRYLQSLENMQVVLSGMTTMEQLKENIAIYSSDTPTTKEENALLMEVVDTMTNMVQCTACRYCCDDCPQQLDIPKLISMHNETTYEVPFTMHFTLDAMPAKALPASCISCGKCLTMCPQGIDIPKIMQEFAVTIENWKKNRG